MRIGVIAALSLVICVAPAGCGTETGGRSTRIAGPPHVVLSDFDLHFDNNASQELSALFFGDSGTGDAQQRTAALSMARTCQNLRCRIGFLLGDAIYETGVRGDDDPQFVSKFEDMYSALGFPLFLALGNHDWMGDWQAMIRRQSRTWKMPGAWYEVETRLARFLVINTNDILDTPEQLAWLTDRLKLRDKWAFVVGHVPLISYGMHGSNEELASALSPALCANGAPYLAGHDHDLQIIQAPCGIPLVVSGAAAKVRKTNAGAGTLFAAEQLGYTQISIGAQYAVIRMFNASDDLLFTYNYLRK